MLHIDKIHKAIDEFTNSDPEERYEVFIPSRKGKKRGYLGLSGLGDECLRKVWYDWRHTFKKKFPARMLRLFRRGDREEFVFNFLLRGIGFTVHEVDENGKQFKVTDFAGHLSGHMDGVLEIPGEFWKSPSKAHPVLAEYKSYNAKRFRNLTKSGVAKSDPKYFVQMQGYMGYEGLRGSLFCAVCKDDDLLHFEYVPFDKAVYKNRVVGRAETVITSTSPPEKLSEIPSHWQCKYCEAADICHKGAPALQSCRSCVYAEPTHDAEWVCVNGGTYGELCGNYQDITK